MWVLIEVVDLPRLLLEVALSSVNLLIVGGLLKNRFCLFLQHSHLLCNYFQLTPGPIGEHFVRLCNLFCQIDQAERRCKPANRVW